MDRNDEHRFTPGERIRLPQTSAMPTIWLATPAGLVDIDTIAVERAMNGERQGWTLTDDEARYAARIMFEHKVPYSVVAARVGRSTGTLRGWFPEQVVPSNPALARPGYRTELVCGTPRGYRAHHRRKETPCGPCKGANAALDRYYRRNGTTVGFPGIGAVGTTQTETERPPLPVRPAPHERDGRQPTPTESGRPHPQSRHLADRNDSPKPPLPVRKPGATNPPKPRTADVRTEVAA